MAAERIRPIAIAVVRNGDRLLVEHGYDSVKDEHFFRPLGGGIEFQELAIDALRREFREELEAELLDPMLIGVLENIFHYDGKPGHDVVFVFEARFAETSLNGAEELFVTEGPARMRATWKTLEQLAGPEPLYPTGLLELLQQRIRESQAQPT